MSDELVTIAEFETAFEAELIKNTLEDNDIKTIVVGQNLTIMPVPMPTIAAIEVKVFAKDAEQAKAILDAQQSQNEDVINEETGEDA
jgi:hypothetical protein